MSGRAFGPRVVDQDEATGLFDVDPEDLIAEIMDEHPHLLDQQDDMEYLAPYNSAMPATPAPMIDAGPAAAQPGIHAPAALHRQNADSPPPPRSIRPPAHHPSGHQQPPRQDLAPRQVAQNATVANHRALSKQHTLHKKPVLCKEPLAHKESAFRKQTASHRQTTDHRSRLRYQSLQSSALHDHGRFRQSNEQGIQEHYDELCQEISDLSLRDQAHSQHVVGDRARRHKSSFVKNPQSARHAERFGCSSSSQKGHAHLEPAMTADFDVQTDQTSSREWEDEDDEDEYEQVTANSTKRACNGNEPEISTNQDLKYTSLIWAESSAKMMYLCGRKMYEVIWTSQTSQRLRRSAMYNTKSASSRAVDGLGRLVMGTYRRPLGSVKHYVSHRHTALKAARWSPREAARWSLVRAMRVSRMRMTDVATPILKLVDEEPKSDIEDNWDLCDDLDQDDSSNAHFSSTYDYGNEGWDAPGLFEDYEI